MKRTKKTVFACVTLLALFSGSGVAAPKKGGGLGSSISTGGGSKGGADRSFLMSMPLVAEGTQARLHLEYNIAAEAGLAIEAGLLGDSELLSEKEVDEMGNSLKTRGAQGALLMSRYSEPKRLGGFFWSLGAGYRQYTAEWKKRPNPNEVDKEMRLDSADTDGYLHHRINGRGTFAVGRVGYRYVADEWPIAIGGHLGLRHMTSSIQDVEVDQEEESELNLQYSPTTPAEKKSVRNRLMTTPDFTVDIGLIF